MLAAFPARVMSTVVGSSACHSDALHENSGRIPRFGSPRRSPESGYYGVIPTQYAGQFKVPHSDGAASRNPAMNRTIGLHATMLVLRAQAHRGLGLVFARSSPPCGGGAYTGGVRVARARASSISIPRGRARRAGKLGRGVACVAASLLYMFSMASFGQSVQVDSELIAEIRQPIRTSQGAVAYRFERATLVRQGAVVYYTVRVRNPTTAYARNVVVVQKIPENTAYVAGSATGPAVEVSLSADRGRSFTTERKSASPAGNAEQAASVQHTHIRWRFRNAIAPGATALARFRAVFQ